MNLLQSVRSARLAVPDYIAPNRGPSVFPWGVPWSMPGPGNESIGSNFAELAAKAYQGNAVVAACELTRVALFSEARFQFQRMSKGRPGDLFGTADLDILENPWPQGMTGDLLSRLLLDADLGGSAFVARRAERRNRLMRMRPDWVTIVMGSEETPTATNLAMDADFLGVMYHPGGRASGQASIPLLADEVAHFAPLPDPLAAYRGMSWMTPLVREIEGDQAATEHKLNFFRNGATPQMVVSMGAEVTPANLDTFVRKIEAHSGVENAYRTLYLGGGADVTVVGRDLAQLDFKLTQGAGETRIAANAGVHPTIVGLSEGLQGSSLNAGNFGAAKRLVADRTLRPLWRSAAAAFTSIVPPPGGSRLWYDVRDIAFLQEDRKDAADIALIKAQTIRQYVDSGFDPDSAVLAAAAEDETLLVHTGRPSVQLQNQAPAAPPASPNGFQQNQVSNG